MATFEIREDSLENKKSTKITKIQSKNDNKGRSRTALCPVENQQNYEVKNGAKRIKLHVDKEKPKNNGKPSKTQLKPTVNSTILSLDGLQLVTKEPLEVQDKENDAEKNKIGVQDAVLYSSEYRKDIWRYLFEKEKVMRWPKATYMKRQPHINAEMRCVLVDWLATVAEEYKMSAHTLHLSVYYVDRFLSNMSVVREKFQLLGSAAMMVAGKVEEIYPPDTKEWTFLTGNSYKSYQVVRMEQLLLKVIRFDLHPPTSVTFIKQICAEHAIDKKTMNLAMYLADLVLLEGQEYLDYLPSKVAAAALALARFTLSSRNPWSKKLEESFGYSLKQLSPVLQKQNKTFRDSPTTPQQAIQEKYRKTKYHKVASLKPKILILDFESDD